VRGQSPHIRGEGAEPSYTGVRGQSPLFTCGGSRGLCP